MQIIPVLDILNGVVVHAVAGDRERYRPVTSELSSSRDPAVLLRTMRDTFGLDRFYLADLDAIQRSVLNRCTIAELTRECDSLIVDRGVRKEADIEELLELGVADVVVAVESLPDLETAELIHRSFGSDRLILSLDLKAGEPLAANPDWHGWEIAAIADDLIAAGFNRLIVLDLAAVGVGGGVPTRSLCRQLRIQLPAGEIITGGGVRSVADLRALQSDGIDGALVASALHQGQISAEDLATLRSNA